MQDYLNAGRAIQRFWLTSAKLGLGFQPEQTPVIFAKYLRQGIHFTDDNKVLKNAEKGKKLFEEIVTQADHITFLGRLGRSQMPKSRSLRKPLSELMVNKSPKE